MSTFQRWVIFCVLAGSALAVTAATPSQGSTTRDDLVGTWRLDTIEITTPQGTSADPFYGASSEGLLIYDASGWFSVQIMGSNRPPLRVPERRPADSDVQQRALKAAALDSYYAYFGTWTFDAAKSTVTHHARGALYPSEQDAVYPQHVEVHGTKMVFTRSQDINGQRSTQSKIWVRAAKP
jgi:Lipocalin-like domain